ncbi:arrestin domain-containing protein 2-like isoform X2 [Phymastichus coffea]|uniref:arrestin domain-containing protein 2-like isoform X2 n=1 Tax=Phymastichus coffea TaxID=108790 RepID=UPI00273B594D|nr:arrestin domain-containing protein 2-like isoform X2 [Phymastichus coffea]
MHKLQDFRIDFDKPDATYEPGENVSGKVILNLSGSKNVKEIRLEARGAAEVHWTKNRKVKDSSGRRHRHTDHYKNSEHYFSISNRLLGSGTADGQTTIPAGQHSYFFSFQLPFNIPCSIEHKYGRVRYVVNAILHRPWKFDHKVLSAFSVIAPYNLNTQENVTSGIHDEITRTFLYCGCCTSGGMKINADSQVSGFVPGEIIKMLINYDNYSTRVNITKLKLKLIKNMTFHASSPIPDKMFDTEIVEKVKKNRPFGKKGESLLNIQVPSLPPSNLEYCSIIRVSYQLALCINVSGLHFNIKRLYPVQLGTVPLFHQTANLSHYSVTPYIPSAPPIDQVTSIPQPMPQPPHIGFALMDAHIRTPAYPSQPEMAPPSYEECVYGVNTVSNQNEQRLHGSTVQFIRLNKIG